jgi:lipopolysaccharide biosynthesis glycosyltransferase
LSRRLIGKLERSVETLELSWFDARSSAFEEVCLPGYLKRSSLFRLRIEELLPPEVDRVLYLDADVLVRRPLAELWDTPLDGKLIGAVRDPTSPWVSAVRGFPWREIGIPPTTPYFNAGVMLIPLDRWRGAHVGERALALLRRHEFVHADQCALNAVLCLSWQPLDRRWNTQWAHLVEDGTLAWVAETDTMSRSASEDAAVMHFNSGRMRRPWDPRCSHPYRGEWLSMVEHTAWAGWRPDRRGKGKRALQRLRKAGRVLAHDQLYTIEPT